jgi:hypothetical protein
MLQLYGTIAPSSSYWDGNVQDLVEKEVKSFIVTYMYGENGITLTPRGLSWSPAGAPLSNAANAAMIALLYSKSLGDGMNQLKVGLVEGSEDAHHCCHT